MKSSGRTRRFAQGAAALAATLALAGCGGDDLRGGAATTIDEAQEQLESAVTGDQQQALREEAARIDALIDSTLADLQEARSLDEVDAHAETAEEELAAARERVSELELEGEAEQLRADLESATADLEGDIEELQQAVRDRDLPGALRGVSDLSVSDVRRAVEEIETELGS